MDKLYDRKDLDDWNEPIWGENLNAFKIGNEWYYVWSKEVEDVFAGSPDVI